MKNPKTTESEIEIRLIGMSSFLMNEIWRSNYENLFSSVTIRFFNWIVTPLKKVEKYIKDKQCKIAKYLKIRSFCGKTSKKPTWL